MWLLETRAAMDFTMMSLQQYVAPFCIFICGNLYRVETKLYTQHLFTNKKRPIDLNAPQVQQKNHSACNESAES